MDRSASGAPRSPRTFSPGIAKALMGLSIFILLLAVMGGFLYEGWHRVAYVTAFLTMGVANLALGFVSLRPQSRVSRFAAPLITPLAAVMLVALAVTLGFQFGWLS